MKSKFRLLKLDKEYKHRINKDKKAKNVIKMRKKNFVKYRMQCCYKNL